MLRRVLVGLSTVCIGVAVGLLVWAAGLSVWSWLVPKSSVGYPAWSATDWGGYRPPSHWATMSPKDVALSICVVAAVLVAAVVLLRFNWASGYRGLLVPLAGIALVYLRSTGSGMQEFCEWMQDFPVTPKLPTAAASWWLAAAGALAAAVAAPAAVRLTRSSRWLVGIGVVIAVAAAGVTTTSALRAGDDSRFVDATTALSTAVPPSPDHLGQKAFTIRIADYIRTESGRNWRIERGGAGFIALGGGRVTAYGSDGAERWHYRRSGPGHLGVDEMAVFDQASTVVLLGGSPSTLIGLDAMTGRELWSSTDRSLVHAFGGYVNYIRRRPPYLLANSDLSKWTRYDTRTGRPMWTVPAPSTECQGWYGGLTSLPGSVYRCVSGDKADVRFVDIDPSTGQIRWKTTLLSELPYSGQNRNAIRPRIEQAGRDGYTMGAQLESGDDVGAFVNAATRHVLDFHGHVSVYRTRDDSADFLSRGPDRANASTLRGPDGQARCALPEPPLADISEARAAILGAEVVFAEKRLEVFSRENCAPIAVVPQADYVEDILAAPGAVLVVRTDDSGTYVDGYR
ncbi:PQQ enzyme repeat [Mycobacteroides abscessus subsp. abscessus]|nr:PQQ enzyme repeat [Mycobacteroides abscessus subsp. abscessus]